MLAPISGAQWLSHPKLFVLDDFPSPSRLRGCGLASLNLILSGMRQSTARHEPRQALGLVDRPATFQMILLQVVPLASIPRPLALAGGLRATRLT